MTRLTTCAILLALPLVALAQASRPSSPEARLTKELPPVVFAGMGLEKALAKLSELSGLDIRGDWPTLAQAGIRQDTPVQFRSEKASLDKLLDLLLAGVSRKPLAWYRQGEQVIVSTQQGVMLRNQGGREPTSAAPAGPAKGGDAPAAKTFRGDSLGGRPSKLELNDTPLAAALELVRDLAGVNMYVNWRSLELAGVTRESTVSLKARDVTPSQMLDLILETFNGNKDKLTKLYWVIDAGVVKVATGEALNTTTTVRTYEVSDLLIVVPSFAAPPMNLSSNASTSGGSTGVITGTDRSAQRQEIQNSLLQTIRDSIGQDMWQPTGRGNVQVFNGRLVISQTQLGFKLMEQAFP